MNSKEKKSRSSQALELLHKADIELAIGAEAVRRVLPGWFEEDEYRKIQASRLRDQAAKLLTPEEDFQIHKCGEVIPGYGQADNLVVSTLEAEPNQLAVDASHERLSLLADIGIGAMEVGCDATMSIHGANSLEKMLAHQLGVVHIMAMKFIKGAQNHLRRSESLLEHYPDRAGDHADVAAKLNRAAARLMDTYQRGVKALYKVRVGNQQIVRVIHQHVHVTDGGQAIVAGDMKPASCDVQNDEGLK